VVALVGADLDCHNLDDLAVETRRFDLLDERGVLEALEGGELLVHNAACYSFWHPDPGHIYRVNVTGTQHVMRAARQHGYRKIVYTSSTATLTPSINREVESEESLFDLRSFQGH
jgi:dihydroflavonol-4-reductase